MTRSDIEKMALSLNSTLLLSALIVACLISAAYANTFNNSSEPFVESEEQAFADEYGTLKNTRFKFGFSYHFEFEIANI